MKPHIYQLAAILALFPFTGHCQPSSIPPQPGQLSAPSVSSPLPENYKLTCKGTEDGKVFMNIAMTGLGPNFSMNTAEPIAAFQAQVQKKDDSFLISYSIGQQVKVTTGNNNTEYKNTAIVGSVKLHEGKPVMIAVENGRNYSLSIEAAKNTAEQDAAANP